MSCGRRASLPGHRESVRPGISCAAASACKNAAAVGRPSRLGMGSISPPVLVRSEAAVYQRCRVGRFIPARGTDRGVALRDSRAPGWSPASSWATGRRARSVTAGRRTTSGIDRICSWISGARRSKPRTWVTRARVIRSLRAISAWLGTWPDMRRARHSMAFRRSSTTRGVLGSFGGLGLPRRGGTALTTRSAGTRRVRVPMLPFSKAPLGPRAISTACSR